MIYIFLKLILNNSFNLIKKDSFKKAKSNKEQKIKRLEKIWIIFKISESSNRKQIKK
jgi:hypothetical protein